MSAVDHTSRGHALLSASGADRWMACPPSARLEEKAHDKSGDSIYAQEGTLAHELSDIVLHRDHKGMPAKTFNAEKRKLKAKVVKLMGSEAAWAEMEREIKKYTDIVSEAYAEAKAISPGAVIMLEERLDYSYLVPQGFGTGDAVIIGDGLLRSFDLKYGKGIRVEAKTNKQQMLYGLGALRQFDMAFDIKRVQMSIVQPRLDNFSTWECSVEYLHKWGRDQVAPLAKLAFAGEGEKKAGEHCKWCKVKVFCRALADHNLEIAQNDFKDPPDLDIAEMADIHKRASMVTDWLGAIKSHLQAEALKGTVIPGHKLVIGKSSRSWTDQELVKKVLREEGHKDAEFMVSKLQGIPYVEKLLGKDKFYEKLSSAFVKPQGAPTLADVSDKRQPYGLASAKADFKDIQDEG